MEVADDRHAHAQLVESLDDVRNGFRGGVIIHGHADHFTAGLGQRRHLLHGSGDVRGIGIGHGLHHNRCRAANFHAANHGGHTSSALNFSHMGSSILAGLDYGNHRA